MRVTRASELCVCVCVCAARTHGLVKRHQASCQWIKASLDAPKDPVPRRLNCHHVHRRHPSLHTFSSAVGGRGSATVNPSEPATSDQPAAVASSGRAPEASAVPALGRRSCSV